MIDGLVCCVRGFVYTQALMVGVTADGHLRRYCFEHEADAVTALNEWGGSDHPPGPWIKCKGAGVDILNPAML